MILLHLDCMLYITLIPLKVDIHSPWRLCRKMHSDEEIISYFLVEKNSLFLSASVFVQVLKVFIVLIVRLSFVDFVLHKLNHCNPVSEQ